jgi:hypothetical protein
MYATTFKCKSGSLSKESFLTKEQHEQCKEIVECKKATTCSNCGKDRLLDKKVP